MTPPPDAGGGLEVDGRFSIGRDPREMTRDELQALGHGKQPLLRVIRARCLDCCCEQPAEVRKCTAIRCANWPYRMGTDPFSNRTGNPNFHPARPGEPAIQAPLDEGGGWGIGGGDACKTA